MKSSTAFILSLLILFMFFVNGIVYPQYTNIHVTGRVANAKTEVPLSAKLVFKINGVPIDSVFTDSTGFYSFISNFNDSNEVIVFCYSENYLNAKSAFLPTNHNETFVLDYGLIKIRDSQIISCPEFPVIQFNSFKYEIDNDSLNKNSLDYLYHIMIENPTIVIELTGHSDYIEFKAGSAKRIAHKRVVSSKKYLVNLGINEKRIQISSYGYKRPLITEHEIESAVSDKGIENSEQYHLKNRRVAISVIRADFVSE